MKLSSQVTVCGDIATGPISIDSSRRSLQVSFFVEMVETFMAGPRHRERHRGRIRCLLYAELAERAQRYLEPGLRVIAVGHIAERDGDVALFVADIGPSIAPDNDPPRTSSTKEEQHA